jgi:hypothetical protein
MNIISLRIDGKDINIEPPNDTPKFSMTVDFAYGSCPYLLVYDSSKRYWKELGTILYGKSHPKLQNYELYNLENNISKIKIEEREPEITYIESLSVIFINSETKEKEEKRIILTGLAHEQDGYFVLCKGQSLEICLENLISVNAADIKLKIRGYYEILK